jgi:hypothetical protein
MALPLQKQRRVLVSSALLTVGTFIWLTAGTDAQSLLFERIEVSDQRIVFLVLLISALTLLSTLSGLPILYLSIAIGFLLNFTPALLICWGVNVLAVLASLLYGPFRFYRIFQGEIRGKETNQTNQQGDREIRALDCCF